MNFLALLKNLKTWHPRSREVTKQEIQEEPDNAFNQVEQHRRAPPMEKQHMAFQAEEEKILADDGDGDI